jgi:hypothetical protein
LDQQIQLQIIDKCYLHSIEQDACQKHELYQAFVNLNKSKKDSSVRIGVHNLLQKSQKVDLPPQAKEVPVVGEPEKQNQQPTPKQEK